MVQNVTIVEYLWCKFLVISICNKINEIVNVKLEVAGGEVKKEQKIK